jgi:hypothetical protein
MVMIRQAKTLNNTQTGRFRMSLKGTEMLEFTFACRDGLMSFPGEGTALCRSFLLPKVVFVHQARATNRITILVLATAPQMRLPFAIITISSTQEEVLICSLSELAQCFTAQIVTLVDFDLNYYSNG